MSGDVNKAAGKTRYELKGKLGGRTFSALLAEAGTLEQKRVMLPAEIGVLQ